MVNVHDPHALDIPEYSILRNIDDAMKGADAIVIFPGHHQYKNLDPDHIRGLSAKSHPAIIDGRNMIDPDLFISRGFVYKGIGRGDKNMHKIVEYS